jgi:hypothetical protein
MSLKVLSLQAAAQALQIKALVLQVVLPVMLPILQDVLPFLIREIIFEPFMLPFVRAKTSSVLVHIAVLLFM